MTKPVSDADALASMTLQEQANFHAMMGQRVRLKPNPDGTIPARPAKPGSNPDA